MRLNGLLEVKKMSFAKSQYESAKKVLAPEWTPTTLELRQQEMAKWASSIWRVPYADNV